MLQPQYAVLDITSLLHMLIDKQVKLTSLNIFGFQYDTKTMKQYLITSSTSMEDLRLYRPCSVLKQPFPVHEIGALHSLTQLELLYLSHVDKRGTVGLQSLRPIVYQLHTLQLYGCSLCSCKLRENHLMDLFSLMNRANQLEVLRLCFGEFSVRLTKSLVRCLEEMPHL